MDKLDEILRQHTAQDEDTTNKLLGASFVVLKNAEIVYSGSSGRLGLDTASPPFDSDTSTWFASMTKLITSTCVMQLVERGEIGLDADLRELIPEFENIHVLKGINPDGKPILEPNETPINLRHLLTHTLGQTYDILDPDVRAWSASINRTSHGLTWNRDGFNTPLRFHPGAGWIYGTAIDWAGLLLENIAGHTLGAYMQQHVFDPLGMRDTGFWPEKLPQTQTQHRTTAYVTRDADGVLTAGSRPAPAEHEVESGGAGLYSTAHDYALFLQGFLQGKLLKEETLQHMFTPQLDEVQRLAMEATLYHPAAHDGFAPEFPAGLKLNHGLGAAMNAEDVPGKRRKGSLMWSGMGNSRWWIDRESGVAAVLIVQVLPFGDPVVKSLYNDLEVAVYESLETNP